MKTLRDARREAGLTQEELAVRARVSRATIARAEAGVVPRPAQRHTIQRVLRTPIAWGVAGSGSAGAGSQEAR
jgi:transcriptional regulator with XRE-family HTH domain